MEQQRPCLSFCSQQIAPQDLIGRFLGSPDSDISGLQASDALQPNSWHSFAAGTKGGHRETDLHHPASLIISIIGWLIKVHRESIVDDPNGN